MNSTIHLDFDKNKSYLKNCLELVQYAGDCDDVKTLVNLADVREVSDAVHRLESACLKKMLDFEEDVGGGKPKKALILGLGTRVRACKKLIGEAMNSKEPELMELSKLRVHQLIQAPIFAASSHVHGRRFILTSNPQIPLEMREPLHPTLAAHSLDFVHLSTLGRE